MNYLLLLFTLLSKTVNTELVLPLDFLLCASVVVLPFNKDGDMNVVLLKLSFVAEGLEALSFRVDLNFDSLS